MAEGFNNLLYPTTIISIQTVKRFIQNQQLRIFNKGTCQQRQALFSTGKLQERFIFQFGDAKYIHPPFTNSHLLRLGAFVQSDTVMKTTGHDFNSRQILEIGTVHLRTYISNMFFNFPNTLSCSSLSSEKADITSIGLWIICTDKA